jgi:hypothetical protein
MKSPKFSRVFLSIGLVVFGVLVTGMIAKVFSTTAAADVAYPNAAYPNPLITIDEELPSDIIANCDLVFAQRKTLPIGEKRSAEEARYQACINALPPFKVTPGVVPPTSPLILGNIHRRVAGDGIIIENGLAPLPSSLYIILNSWYCETPNEIITVYAGVKKTADIQGNTNSLKGILVIIAMTSSGQSIPEKYGEYFTPAALGPIQIVDAHGQQLTLVASNGTGFFFNVASRKYIFPGPSSPVEVKVGSGKIIETGNSSFSIAPHAFINQWVGEVHGSRVTVLAGTDQKGSHNGLVVVVKISGVSNQVVEEQAYVAPVQYGSLRIVQANGDQLTLVTAGGEEFVFDISTGQFVSWPH